MKEVKANKVEGWDDLKNPGDWYFFRNVNDAVTHLAFCCPCGNCNRNYLSALPIDTGPHDGHPKWQWDGNEEEPTLTPSIQRRVHIHAYGEHPEYKCDWHGYLTKGVFIEC